MRKKQVEILPWTNWTRSSITKRLWYQLSKVGRKNLFQCNSREFLWSFPKSISKKIFSRFAGSFHLKLFDRSGHKS